MILLSPLWSWFERLGGVGLVLLGLVDNSPIPVPGSMDALTVILSAHQKEWWPYYAIMATVGAIVGGYVTYRVAREGGKEGLEKKLSREKAERVYKTFNKYGFWSLFVPALLPPPVPYSPFLIAAGALNYSRHRFFIAVGVGRAIRYTVLAWLGSIYSRQIFHFFHEYYEPMFWTVLALTVLGGIAAAIYVWKRKREGKPLLGRAKKKLKAA
ncbi:MAG TPA: VTT domain-containing protein [Candidatus Angelobacter sp.]